MVDKVKGEKKEDVSILTHPLYLSVVLSGFEPLQTEPKPVVLPLHHRTIAGAKIMLFWFTHKLFVEKLQKFIPFLYS